MSKAIQIKATTQIIPGTSQWTSFFKKGRTIVKTWIQRYQTRQQLMDMNEFGFKDIGATQMEAKVEMKKWFWQK